jgi:hypothetical protein
LDGKQRRADWDAEQAREKAKATAARVAYVKSVQAARKPKAKGGGK